MGTIRAKFEDGVFKPIGHVDLPAHCEVEFEPRIVEPLITAESLDRVYAVLSRRYNSGETDIAERHNEHQP
jgi:predicted DNA-binding antitoxin AbrB/MazE fold protein